MNRASSNADLPESDFMDSVDSLRQALQRPPQPEQPAAAAMSLPFAARLPVDQSVQDLIAALAPTPQPQPQSQQAQQAATVAESRYPSSSQLPPLSSITSDRPTVGTPALSRKVRRLLDKPSIDAVLTASCGCSKDCIATLSRQQIVAAREMFYQQYPSEGHRRGFLYRVIANSDFVVAGKRLCQVLVLQQKLILQFVFIVAALLCLPCVLWFCCFVCRM